MALEVFIDTSGFYALLLRDDDRHGDAASFMREAAESKRRFVTTDYVLDESATLLQARAHHELVAPLFDTVFASKACRVVWMDPDRFHRAKDLFLTRPGQGWSFTDCVSFVVMRELGLREALTKDAHFRRAGFTPLLT